MRHLFALLLCVLAHNNLNAKTFTILHTNDWQSRFLGTPTYDYKPETTGDGTKGGLARLATLIKSRRAAGTKNGPVLLLDGGDWTMGTLFHTITREKGTELQFMSMLGYDAICFGNHDFDFRVDGLDKMIRSAISAVGKIPPILASNIVFSKDDPRDQGLRELRDQGIIRRYLILEREGIRFGLFGIMGSTAAIDAVYTRPVTFSDPVAVSKEMVSLLRNIERVDVVIMLSHSGVARLDDGSWGGEEVEMAEELEGLDVLVGGHSHTPLAQPIMVAGIPVMQAGSETQYLGELVADTGTPRLNMVNYTLHTVDDKIIGDPAFTAKINSFKDVVNQNFLAPRGLKFDAPVVAIQQNAGREHDDNVLGNLLADAFRTATDADIGFIPDGTIRDDLVVGRTGIQTVDDIFRLVPLGVGDDNDSIGYPMIKVYANAKELKGVLEILLVAHDIKDDDSYYPRYAGLRFQYNPYRVPFDRVMDIKVLNKKGFYEEVNPDDETKLFSVATTMYEGKFFWLIDEVSHGLITFVPKDARGKPLKDLKHALVYNADGSQKELKAWETVVRHVQNLPSSGSHGVVPYVPLSQYSDSPMIQVRSLSPRDLFYNATWLQWTASFIMMAGFGVIIGLLLWCSRKLRSIGLRGKMNMKTKRSSKVTAT